MLPAPAETAGTRALNHFFDDELVPASRGVQPDLLRKVEPFPTKELAPYNAGFLSGWVVERIGWNTDPNNNRMVITFSNVESWMPDVYELAKDWNRLSK